MAHPIFSLPLSFPPSYLLLASPPETIKSDGGFCLFYTLSIMEDDVAWSDRAHPVQEMGLVY